MNEPASYHGLANGLAEPVSEIRESIDAYLFDEMFLRHFREFFLFPPHFYCG